MLRDFKVVGN